VNERTPGPVDVATAAVVIGGLLILAMPNHGMSIVRVVIVTVAAAACLHAFVLNAPPTWWNSPFDRKAKWSARAPVTGELDWIRAGLAGRRQRIENGPPLPPGALRLLQPLIRVALEREGVDPGGDTGAATAHELLSPLTRAVLECKILTRPSRLRTLPSDERMTAEIVHRILDELESHAGRPAGPRSQTTTSTPPST
jgi:hypothetical protein